MTGGRAGVVAGVPPGAGGSGSRLAGAGARLPAGGHGSCSRGGRGACASGPRAGQPPRPLLPLPRTGKGPSAPGARRAGRTA